jgi:hypothetical protein
MVSYKSTVQATVKQGYKYLFFLKGIRAIKKPRHISGALWAHLGSNQGPPDYESGALTN